MLGNAPSKSKPTTHKTSGPNEGGGPLTRVVRPLLLLSKLDKMGIGRFPRTTTIYKLKPCLRLLGQLIFLELIDNECFGFFGGLCGRFQRCNKCTLLLTIEPVPACEEHW